jgi:hypothetical protein
MTPEGFTTLNMVILVKNLQSFIDFSINMVA